MSVPALSRSEDHLAQIALQGDCDIRQVQQLYDRIQEAWTIGGAVQLDLREVTRVDTSVLQLLLAYQRSVPSTESSDGPLMLSEPVMALARELGLDHDFATCIAHGDAGCSTSGKVERSDAEHAGNV